MALSEQEELELLLLEKQQAMASSAPKQEQDPTQAQVAKMREGGAMERGLRGAGRSLQNDYYGLKGLVTDLSPQEEQQVRANKQFLSEDTAGAVGGFGADVASFLLPGGVAAKAAAKGLSMLPKAAKVYQGLGTTGRVATQVAGQGALDAGLSAAYEPEDRGEAALYGGAGSLGGQLLGRSLGKLATGVLKPSTDAAKLMDEGVSVPFWKATENPVVRGVVERAKALPLTGAVAKGRERTAIEGVDREWARRATPPRPVTDEAGNVLRWEMDKPVTELGAEGVGKLQDRFNDAYDALYKGRGIPVDEAYGSEVAATVEDVRKYYPRIADEFEAAVRQSDDILRKGTEATERRFSIIDPNTGSPAVTAERGHAATRPESVKAAIDGLNKRITSAWSRGDAELAESLSAVRESLSDLRVRGLPPEVASMAKPINEAYASFKQMQRAARSNAVQKTGVMTPDQMLSAIKATDRTPDKSAFSRGKARNQDLAVTSSRVLGSELPEVGPGTAEKAILTYMLTNPLLATADAASAATIGTLSGKQGQKFLLGGYDKQRALQDFLRRRNLPYAGATGAALMNQ